MIAFGSFGWELDCGIFRGSELCFRPNIFTWCKDELMIARLWVEVTVARDSWLTLRLDWWLPVEPREQDWVRLEITRDVRGFGIARLGCDVVVPAGWGLCCCFSTLMIS